MPVQHLPVAVGDFIIAGAIDNAEGSDPKGYQDGHNDGHNFPL
jgi:hypothetical protein